ncbi:MAG: type II secretion system protein GspK [Planctomycetales bacterium]
MKRLSTRSHAHSRRGLVLIIVLIVVTMVALVGFGFVSAMLTENRAVRVRGHHLQVAQAILSGEEAIKSALKRQQSTSVGVDQSSPGFAPSVSSPAGPISATNGLSGPSGSGNLFSAPELFRGRALWSEDENFPIGFTVISPANAPDAVDTPGTERYRYGLEDESARLNLAMLLRWERESPGAGQAALMKLPEMTEEIADAILDWLDADSTPREHGAEEDFYAGLNPPYPPRNGLPLSLEELLLVKGVTRELLYGKDRNLNYQVEEGERKVGLGLESTPSFSQQENPGWFRFLTLYSRESNRRPNGSPRIFLNDPDLKSAARWTGSDQSAVGKVHHPVPSTWSHGRSRTGRNHGATRNSSARGSSEFCTPREVPHSDSV